MVSGFWRGTVVELHAVDAAAEQIAKSEAPDCLSHLETLAAAVGRSPSAPISPREVFSSDVANEERQLLLAVSLRAIAAASPCLDETDFRVAVWAFLDRSAGDLYRLAGITGRQQTYEKQQLLRRALDALDTEFATVLARLTDASRVRDGRTRFMKWLNSPFVRASARPLISDRLAVTQLGGVFDDVDAYLAAEGPSAVREYDRASQAVVAFVADVEALRTLPAGKYLLPVANRLKEIIAGHFEAAALGKPAKLSVVAAPKKYPLHEAGRTIAVGLVIRNDGEGPADDVRVHTTDATGNIEPESDEIYLGRMEERLVGVQIRCRVVAPEEVALLSVQIEWRNYEGSLGQASFDVGLSAQRTDVDWDRLQLEDPYSLEPVESEDELSGRTEQLAQLTALATRKQLGSLILFGQKRVGKTSIARTLAARLRRTASDNYHVVYVEGGDFVDPDARRTVSNLGRRICEELRGADPRLEGSTVPTFDGALTPLGDFLREAQRAVDGLRVLFIIDEFDELPIELYRRGPVGDALS
jgi:AAA domain